MINKIVTLLLVFAVTGGALHTTAFAQASQTKQEKKAAEVKTKINKLGTGEKVFVKVKLYNYNSYEGNLTQANDNDFVVVDKAGASHTINYADVKSIGGKNMSNGAKIAIGLGIGAGVTLLVLLLVFQHITQNN